MQLPYKALVMAMQFINEKSAVRENLPIDFSRLRTDKTIKPQPLKLQFDNSFCLFPFTSPNFSNLAMSLKLSSVNEMSKAHNNHRVCVRFNSVLQGPTFYAYPPQLNMERINMDVTELESVTPTMSTWCSNQLSYTSQYLDNITHLQQTCNP